MHYTRQEQNLKLGDCHLNGYSHVCKWFLPSSLQECGVVLSLGLNVKMTGADHHLSFQINCELGQTLSLYNQKPKLSSVPLL